MRRFLAASALATPQGIAVSRLAEAPGRGVTWITFSASVPENRLGSGPTGSPTLLTAEHRQESLSRAYIHAVAGHVGMSCSVRDYDYGIDLTLHEVHTTTNKATGRKRYIESGWPLDVQIKSTVNVTAEADEVVFDLDVDAYNDLRDPEVQSPRILVLHVQPRDEQRRLEQTPDGLRLGGCCYWICLRGYPDIPNTSSTRIRIPRGNVFCAEQLQEIMRRIKTGEPL